MPCMTTRILLYPQWQNPTENHMSFNKIHPLKYTPLSAVLLLFLLPFSRSLGIHIKVILWHVGAHRSSQVWIGSFRAQRNSRLKYCVGRLRNPLLEPWSCPDEVVEVYCLRNVPVCCTRWRRRIFPCAGPAGTISESFQLLFLTSNTGGLQLNNVNFFLARDNFMHIQEMSLKCLTLSLSLR